MGLTRLGAGGQDMEKHLASTWKEFEAWIRDTIGSDFCGRIRPQDTAENREIIAGLIQDGIRRNNDVFHERSTSIERE